MAVYPRGGSRFRPSACSTGAMCGIGLTICHSFALWVVLVEVLAPIALETFPSKNAASITTSRLMPAAADDHWGIPAESFFGSYQWSMEAEGMEEKNMGQRRMQEGGSQGFLLNILIQLGAIVVMVVGQFVGLWCYYRCYIRDTAAVYIPPHAITPPEMMGAWAFGEFDCCADMGTCCCFCFCSLCSISDLWYRAGFIHGIVDSENPCTCCGDIPGWRYFICAFLFMFAQFVGGFPCLAAFFRGGARWIDQGNGGLDTKDLRQRFGIKHDGCSTFCTDCLLWCFCPVCAATQEYRQVMKFLNSGRGYTEDGNVVVVGAPVHVGNKSSPGSAPA